MSAAEIPQLPGIAPLVAHYDGFILDLWGVMHDGRQCFPWAIETLARLRAAGRRVVLVSNAPRRESVVARRNAEIGLRSELTDELVTSGEEAWRHLAERPDAFYRSLGRRCLHLGSSRDHSMREGLSYDFVARPQNADFILNTGSADEAGQEAATESLLREAASLHLPMICANPDRTVISHGRRELCAGAFAERYEALGGRVRYHGKPHPEVYARALALLAVPHDRVLCVGDSMETDMRGAAGAGLPALFVASGIHEADVGVGGKGLLALAAEHGVAPIAAVPRFAW